MKDGEVTWVLFSKENTSLKLDKFFVSKHLMRCYFMGRVHLSVIVGSMVSASKTAGVQPSFCTYRTGSPGHWSFLIN